MKPIVIIRFAGSCIYGVTTERGLGVLVFGSPGIASPSSAPR
jgi:hypothetical protein